MSERITQKNLDKLCDTINKVTNSPMTPYTRIDGKTKANLGNYHISSAYGGVCLQRMSNESGGVSTVINLGYTTKRNLYDLMNAYLKGLREVTR